MVVPEIIYSTVANKCPRCHRGKFFENNNAYKINGAFKMQESCTHCNLKYEREPGFFFGALYVSYALLSGVFIIWFLVDLIWLQLDPIVLFLIVLANMSVLFPLAFRWARLIWINFFVRYDKKYNIIEHENLKTN